MKLTSVGLKKPDKTDPVNVGDLNDNADLMNQELLKRPEKTGDAGDMTVAFTEAQSLTEPNSGETLKGIMGKLKLTVKNTMSILRLLGTTDISAIGGGTVTGAVAQLNSDLKVIRNDGSIISIRDTPFDSICYDNANFIAQTPSFNSTGLCGYGFHYPGRTGAFLYVDPVDARLYLKLSSNDVFQINTTRV